MRKVAAAGIIGLMAAGGAAVALAQSPWPSLTVTPIVSPNKAGTPQHPQGVHLTTIFHWQDLGQASQPIVITFHLLFPKGSLYQGSKYPICSLARVSQGPQACPKGSIMGHGSGVAYADTTKTVPQITVVNGGASHIWFYTVLNNPARVQEPVIGTISRLGGKWAYSLSVTVPQNLRVVAGVPIELTSLNVTAGGGAWIATTGCTGGKWPYQVTTGYENPNTNAMGSYTYNASVHCRK
jgi:hypothetical protein